jgi:putative peptide zinc metalloprotease protein
LIIASFATLAWNFLPIGFLRDMAFIMASITWVSSVIINASPFLRFDGYYLLSDYWNIPNLHERSGRLARWWLRERLFDINEKKPEVFRKKTEILLILFAFAVWIYRLILFTGIALLVYNLFFKFIGIFLFIIEIVWFVIRPIWLELREWRMRKNIIFLKKRFWLVLVFLFLIVISLFVPWRGTITLEAVIEAKPYSVIFAKTEGRLERFIPTDGALVAKGQLIVKLKNPNLDSQLRQLVNKIEVKKKILQLSAFDELSWKRNAIILAELVQLKTERSALTQKIDSLNIYAPTSGVYTEILSGVFVGQWLRLGQRLFSIKGNQGFKVTAYLNEEDVMSIEEGGLCHLKLPYLNNQNYLCSLRKIGSSSEGLIEEKMLATLYGGSILANSVEGGLAPSQAVYKLMADVQNKELVVPHKAKGLIEIETKKRNMINRFWLWFVSIIIREGGM